MPESFQAAVERRLANSPKKDYGTRPDGSKKGAGWLGEIDLGDGNVATEYTMQSGAVKDKDGNQIDFPTIVPTLSSKEVDILKSHIRSKKPLPEPIIQKAIQHARKQIAEGKSVFAPTPNK